MADNEQKLGKLGESKFIHMTVNGGDCNVYAHSSLWMRPTRPDRYNAKMVYKTNIDCSFIRGMVENYCTLGKTQSWPTIHLGPTGLISRLGLSFTSGQ